ncbi:MAG: Hsp20/alpha crystallin family protein [Bacteroidota bacterium]
MKLAVRNNRNYPTFNSFFNDFFGEDFGVFHGGATPAVNVKEEDDKFLLEVSAPGRNKEDFKLEVNNKILTISSEWKEANETEEAGKYTRREFRYGSFQRSFTLPNTVDGYHIKAHYENGVLSLTLPKREEAKEKGARLIEIS